MAKNFAGTFCQAQILKLGGVIVVVVVIPKKNSYVNM